jgi:hypothetical protein
MQLSNWNNCLAELETALKMGGPFSGSPIADIAVDARSTVGMKVETGEVERYVKSLGLARLMRTPVLYMLQLLYSLIRRKKTVPNRESKDILNINTDRTNHVDCTKPVQCECFGPQRYSRV